MEDTLGVLHLLNEKNQFRKLLLSEFFEIIMAFAMATDYPAEKYHIVHWQCRPAVLNHIMIRSMSH